MGWLDDLERGIKVLGGNDKDLKNELDKITDVMSKANNGDAQAQKDLEEMMERVAREKEITDPYEHALEKVQDITSTAGNTLKNLQNDLSLLSSPMVLYTVIGIAGIIIYKEITR